MAMHGTTAGRDKAQLMETLRADLVSVAALEGVPVRGAAGEHVGKLRDVTVRWEEATYPAITGLLLRVGPRSVYLPATEIARIEPDRISLATNRLDLREFERRPGEVLLLGDVVDHQLVDVDGIQVIRTSDLYLANIGDRWRLVGADVSMASLLRRLGPRRRRGRITPTKVIDWASIQPFSRVGEPMEVTFPRASLHQLRPAELADLLEDLSGPRRQQLLGILDPETAADAVEEMDDQQAADLLTSMDPRDAADVLGRMDDDEATDALRRMPEDDRAEVLAQLAVPERGVLQRLLRADPETAGGIMTTQFVAVRPEATAREVLEQLRDGERDLTMDAVVIVDAAGGLIDDVTVLELALADPSAPVESLVGPPWPVTLSAEAPLRDVVDGLADNRGASVLVLDEARRPVGRIRADDVVDALSEHTGNRREH